MLPPEASRRPFAQPILPAAPPNFKFGLVRRDGSLIGLKPHDYDILLAYQPLTLYAIEPFAEHFGPFVHPHVRPGMWSESLDDATDDAMRADIIPPRRVFHHREGTQQLQQPGGHGTPCTCDR